MQILFVLSLLEKGFKYPLPGALFGWEGRVKGATGVKMLTEMYFYR